MVLRGDSVTGQWFLAEKAVPLPDGRQHLLGKIYDVTDAVQPAITHTNLYVRRLEDALYRLVRELYAARGLTPTDSEIIKYFENLKDKIKADEKI